MNDKVSDPAEGAPDEANSQPATDQAHSGTLGGAAVSEIASALNQERSPVSEGAVAAHEAQQREQREAWADLRDADGNPFDPSIHATDSKTGEPSLTKNGKLRRRPGRKSGSGQGTQSTLGKPSQPLGADQSKPDSIAQARATGTFAAGALITLGMALGGEEWKPVKTAEKDERAFLESAFGDYFVAKGMTDIPPGIALTIAIGAYVGPRLTMPRTQSRMERLRVWAAKKIAERKARKKAPPRDVAKESTAREQAEVTLVEWRTL